MNDTPENDRRLKRAVAAFSKKMNSHELTLFDQLIFVDQYMNVLVGNDVHFPSIEDKEIRHIRADRLKLLGYRYIASETRWTRSTEALAQAPSPEFGDGHDLA